MAQKKVVLRIGYNERFLLDVEDAAKVAALLACGEGIDIMNSYGKGNRQSLRLFHRDPHSIEFEAAPEVLYPDAAAAEKVIQQARAREEAEEAAQAQREAEEAARQARVLGDGGAAIPLSGEIEPILTTPGLPQALGEGVKALEKGR